MTAYEPTIAQAVFGAAHSDHEADHLSDDLYRLAEFLGRRNPDAQCHGLLGGEFGYGQHFKNAVFEMHPYYWGDCDCGFEDRGQPDGESHTAQCSFELPNFRHFPSGLEVRFYKYIGRGMSSNKSITGRDFRKIIAECISSLKSIDDGAQP